MRQLSGINASFKQYIVKSWEQCTSLAIDPELQRAPKIPEEDFLAICQKRKQLLLNIATPIISKLSPFLDYSSCIIALTDERGIILNIYGKDEFIKEASAYGFAVGANWSEKSVGTNAIGNCLSIGQPMCIVGEDHFVKQWRSYACAASPIRDPFSGEILGCLNLTCYADAFHVFSLALVESLAMIIETTLRNMPTNTGNYNKHDLIIKHFLEASKEADIQDGIVAIDLNGNILAANKVVHSMLSNENYPHHGNIFHFSSKLQKTLNQSHSAPVSFSTKREKNINSDNTYLANFIPIFNNNKIHEGWIGRLLKISSGGRTHGKMMANTKENYSQPIYISSSMSAIINKARKVASFASTKMLLGESGVGKEIIANFIHVNGPRAAQPMIALNCAAIPKELLASELFGYEAGAFTGARQKGKPGIFQLANHGTIFFDEIGDMPLDLQAYLLRVIEEKKVTRLGGTESIPIDVQIIASTNRDLKKLVKENKFRLDLYYRLNVITIVIPPLRERKEDILPLSEYFLEKMREKLDGVKKKLSPEAIEALLNYNWPGNIRELEHVIEMAHAVSSGDVIGINDVGEDILNKKYYPNQNMISGKKTNAEDEKIKMTIRMCGGNMSKAARTLRVSRTTLYRKMLKYDIPLKHSSTDSGLVRKSTVTPP